MKLSYNQTEDRKYIRKLTQDYIIQNYTDKITSGHDAAIQCYRDYGILIDFHEFAYTLDAMTRTGHAQFHSSGGGDTRYLIIA